MMVLHGASGGHVVTFEAIDVGKEFDRPQLAQLWGYKDWHAIGRGIVTPSGQPVIVLFVTAEKQEHLPQYSDHFDGTTLAMDGEDSHQNDHRLAKATEAGDQIHLFFRKRHHQAFVYVGRVQRCAVSSPPTGLASSGFKLSRPSPRVVSGRNPHSCRAGSEVRAGTT